MVSRSAIVVLFVGIVLVSLVGVGARAEDVVAPPPEAPTTILDVTLGSADVSLSLLGSWTASVSLGGGFLFSPGLPVQGLDSFPGIDKGFVPNQTPDITASLVILKRLFLDVSILGSFADNSIQMGYRGAPGEVVQSVVLGTQGITIDPSPLLAVPVQPSGSLGAVGRLASGAAVNDLLIRWDATSRKQKTFVGMNELVEQKVELGDYTRGTYFFLPDVGIDPGTLQVYLEDPSGTTTGSDGGRYRLAGFDDVALDSTHGLVTLRAAAKGRVVVHYAKGGAEVGASSIGRGGLPGVPSPNSLMRTPDATPADFDWGVTYLGRKMSGREVAIAGTGNCLLLWEPGDNSPFEIDNSYAFATTPPTDIASITYTFVAKSATAVLPTGFAIVSLPDEKRFTISPRNPANRYTGWFPFSDPEGLIYGPQRDSLTGVLDVDLLVQFLTPVTEMTLESDIVPGSVQVTVNGAPETRFEVDPSSGKLTMLVPVLPNDRVDVSYEKAEQGSTGGDVLLAWRDEIPLSDTVSLSLSAGVRWNANPWTYSQEPYAKSGTVIAAVGLAGSSENLSWSVQAGAAFTDPDTTGTLRLFGMEGTGTALDLSDDVSYPASAPEIAGLTQSNRGKLLYRDYRVYDALGAGTPQPLGVDPPPAVTQYVTGGRMGPYNVLGDTSSESPSLSALDLVFEYTLGAGQWVGAQIPISDGSDVDLSAARSVTIRLKGLPLTGTVSISLEMGSISEDLDGSGVLEAETSSAQAGFSFTDVSNAVTLKVGAGPKLLGNGKLDTEDRNSNGILDAEVPERVVTKTVATPGTSWTTVTIALSDTDRAALVRARGVRIVIAEAGAPAGSATGAIVLDALVFDSAPFWPIVTPPDLRTNVSVRQTTESLAQSSQPSGGDFASSPHTSITYKLFHPNGETNSVLEVSWSGLTPTLPFAVQGFVTQGTGGIQYETIVSYMRSPTPGVTYTFSLLDTSGKGVVWEVSVSDNAWHEVKVSRATNSVTVDGASAGAPDRFDASYGSLSQFLMSVSGASSGVAYVDEIYCTSPAGSVGAALVGSLAVKVPGTILEVGGVPLLSNITAKEDVSLLSAGFAPLYGVPSATEDLSSRTDVSGDVLFTRSSVNLVLRDAGGTLTATGGHSITVPAAGSPVTLTDIFSLASLGGFSREDSVHLSLGPLADLTADASASAQPDSAVATGLLTQSWHGTVSVPALAPLTLASEIILGQAVDSYALVSDWYFARWAHEAALVLPTAEGSDIQRTGSLDVKLGMPAAPVGFTLEANAGMQGTGYSGVSFSQQNDAFLGLNLAAKLGQGGASDLTLSIGYKRELTLTTTPLAGPRFATETDELARVLGMQGYFLTLVPVAEVFADNAGTILPQWEGSTKGSYTPTFTLSMERSYGSRLIDLFLPSSVELSLQQQLQKTNDLTETVIHIVPKAVTRAVNLFGELGSNPLLRGVRTDEYGGSLGASLDGLPGAVPTLSTLSAQAYATLTGTTDNELTVTETINREQSTTLSFSSDLQVLYDWTSRPPNGIRLPLVPLDAAGTGSFQHRESAELTIGYQDQGAYHPFTLILGHATTLVFEKHVSLKAGINLGLDAEYIGSTAWAWRIAGGVSLEGKLTF